MYQPYSGVNSFNKYVPALNFKDLGIFFKKKTFYNFLISPQMLLSRPVNKIRATTTKKKLILTFSSEA